MIAQRAPVLVGTLFLGMCGDDGIALTLASAVVVNSSSSWTLFDKHNRPCSYCSRTTTLSERSRSSIARR